MVVADSFLVCVGGEDPHCSDSYATPTSVYDHLHYLNFTEGCAGNQLNDLEPNHLQSLLPGLGLI